MGTVVTAEARITSKADLKAFDAVGKKFDQLLQNSRRVDQMMAKFQSGRYSVDMFGRSFDAFKGTSRHIETMGISLGNFERRIGRAERAMQSFTRSAKTMGGVVIAAGGLFAGYGAKEIGKKAVVSAAEFDIGVRKQREFTDISGSAQSNILIPQAKKIGQDTQFSNLDAVKAQTKTMQGLPSTITGDIKAEIAAGIMDNVKNYALVMEADLETAAEAIRSYLQTTNKDISTKEKAIAESTKAVNQLVKMAKLGGMSDEDVQQFLKFAAASGSAAGLDSETLMSLGALARRGGLRGDEAGVFIRSAASKLVAPTREGLSALNAAGINYGAFTHMPSSLDPNRLEGQFKQDLGIGFTSSVREKLRKALSDPKVLGDRGSFTAAVTEAVQSQFGTDKDGKLKAADRSKIAKSAGRFYSASGGGVDAQALLDRIMDSSMTLAQLNAFFTDKHGGKAAITQRQRDEYIAGRKALRETGDDPAFAKRKADEIMGGLGGSFERLKGSVDNLILAMGDAQAQRLKAAFDALGGALDSISNMSPAAMRFTTEIGAATAALLAYTGAVKAAQLLTGGSSAAGAAGAVAGGAAAARGFSALRGVGWLAAAVAAYEFGPDFIKSATGSDRAAPGDAWQRGYNATHPADTVDRMRRERDAKRWLRAPEVTPSMTFGTGVGGATRGNDLITVQGTVDGTATISLKLDPSKYLVNIIEKAEAVVQMSGALHNKANGPGSVGRSSPDTAAPPVGR